jgi:hypothetical protein
MAFISVDFHNTNVLVYKTVAKALGLTNGQAITSQEAIEEIILRNKAENERLMEEYYRQKQPNINRSSDSPV